MNRNAALYVTCLFLLTAGFLCVSGCGGRRIPEDTDAEGGSTAVIENLKVEYRRNPLGIEEERPGFSWQMESAKRGQAQSAYRIRVAESRERLEQGSCVWDSGRVESGQSAGIFYEGEPLRAATRYYWDVTVWDEEGKIAQPQEEAWFETGLMGSGWDGAQWIGASRERPENPVPENCRYTITYDFEGGNGAAGFVFGADTDRYGEYYVWTVSLQGETVCLDTCRMDGYQMQEEKRTELAEFCSPEDFRSGRVSMRIEVDGNQAVTYLDGSLVGETSLAVPKAVGRIGLYNIRTEEFSRFDNIRVWGEDGRIYYEEDFEDKDNTIFSPEYIKVLDGMGCAEAGVTLTPGNDGPAPCLRGDFTVEEREVEAARLYASALGIYRLYLNGEAVCDYCFEPGQTVYDKELAYCIYDVTGLLRSGRNRIGVCLGHGWYDRAVGTAGSWCPWGDGPAFLGKLVISYSDGSRQVVVTDESWEACLDGPIRRDDMYQGEFYDATREQEGWNLPEGRGTGWKAAVTDCVEGQIYSLPMRARTREGVEHIATLQPVERTEPEEGSVVLDFGQEFTGVCRITVRGNRGSCIIIRYGEALNTERMRNRDDVPGTVWTRNLLSASDTDYYVLKGEGEEQYEPSLVCRGFRYVQISGLGEEAWLLSAEGVAVMSGMEETGRFESSDIWLNRIYQNTLWAQRSNFVDVPTDCPQRDERLGWAGDIAAFSRSAAYHMDVYSFLRDYLRWLRLEQKSDGACADIAPHTPDQGFGKNGWGDAMVILPWVLYRQYGDTAVVEENFDAMCAWVDYLERTCTEGVRPGTDSYGDHLQYGETSARMTDTAQSAYSALLLSKMAAALGKQEEEQRYREVYERFREGWQREWMLEDGSLTEWTQTAYALGLEYELYPEELREAAGEFLVSCVRYAQHHPSCGYIGLPYLLPALSEAGYGEDALLLLEQKTAPSWGHDIRMGATTTAESWTAYTEYEDGTYAIYGSLNHYALGSVGEWFYSGILGINPAEEEPGFKRILLKPTIGGSLQYARGSYTGVYGTVESGWEREENGYRYRVTIPANTTARLRLPWGREDNTLESGMLLSEAEGLCVEEQDDSGLWLRLASGSYDFQVVPAPESGYNNP